MSLQKYTSIRIDAWNLASLPRAIPFLVTRAEIIRQRLETELAPAFLDVINESHNHSVPKGSETHFKVVIVSPSFDGQPQLARHRKVYAVLGDELRTGLHALTVTARTPAEWATVEGGTPLESPACMGGSKASSNEA